MEGIGGERGSFSRYFNNGCVSRSPKTFRAAVILTHTSSAFDADESKGGNGEVDCRCKGIERELANARSSSRFANAQGARLSSLRNLLNSVIKGFLIMLV